MSKITTYYYFRYADFHLKLIEKVVKNDNFYSVVLNRRVVGSCTDLFGAKKLFLYFINRLVLDSFHFDIQSLISDFDLSVVFNHHRNGFNKRLNYDKKS